MSCQDTCQNGYCLNFGDGNLVCTCKEGWEGANCDIPIIKCQDTCQYGKCVREKCVCYTGWGGENCDTTTRTCEDTCQNGKCVDKKCVCNSDYKGKDCDIERDCLSSKCKNGSCVNDKCVCTGKWVGKNCDRCPQDYLLVKGECIAPGEGWRKHPGDIPYINTCILPGECPSNTTYMGRCSGNTEEDTSYCLPNEVWCHDTYCWGPNNRYSDSWIASEAKSSLLTCDNALTGRNEGYPDRSKKNPNPDNWKYPPDGVQCRQGLGWCGTKNDDYVGRNRYQDPPGGSEYHKITHWLWPDTFQRHCVLKR